MAKRLGKKLLAALRDAVADVKADLTKINPPDGQGVADAEDWPDEMPDGSDDLRAAIEALSDACSALVDAYQEAEGAVTAAEEALDGYEAD